MDLRRQEEERGYNPSPSLSSSPSPSPSPPLKQPTTFSKPLLPLNSSLLQIQQAAQNPIQASTNLPSQAQALHYSLIPSPFSSVSLRQHASHASFSPVVVTWHYRECQRNHAAGMGGHVIDGCCEFMQSDDVTLKCAACGCHRSFHRKEPSSTPNPNNGGTNQRLPPHPAFPSPCAITPSSTDHSSSSTEEMQISSSKKRFRTKFTSEQKDKMLEFAERLTWKFQKVDDMAIDEFCKEAGVSRQVFKVWMHNNKYAYKKQVNQLADQDQLQGTPMQHEGPHQQQMP